MIAILGAGALGRLWAASLPAGRAAFVAKPGQPATLPHERFQFQPLTGAQRAVSVPWLASSALPDLVLVTTKAGDTLNALEAVIERWPKPTPIVLFQNGLGSQQAVARRWPERPILAASTTEGANRPAIDRLIHAGSGTTWIGGLTEAALPMAESVAHQLQTSGLAVQVDANIVGRLWQKLVINAGINPFTALLDCTNGDILASEFYQAHIDTLCIEIATLMQAEGLGERKPEALRAQIEAVARATAANTSSMRSDVLRRRATEIRYINGYLATLGTQLNIPTPVNQMLTEQVQQLSQQPQ